jgi:hypothetical protein
MARTVVPGGGIYADGLGDLFKSLEAVGADKAEIASANRDAAETLVKAALPKVPVLSGRLRTTLRPATDRTLKGAAVASAGRGGAKSYAAPIHWGWARVGASHKGKLTPNGAGAFRNIEPQPFFSEALGYTYQEILDNYNRNMQQLINKHGLGDK